MSSSKNVVITKRSPQRAPTKANEIYVASQSHTVAQLRRAQALLDGSSNGKDTGNDNGSGSDNGHKEIVLHGLGAAMTKAVELALRLRRLYGEDALRMEITTSTETLYDDVEPADWMDEDVPRSQTRQNSAIHIRISLR